MSLCAWTNLHMREVWIRLDLSWTGLILFFYKADICDRCEMYRIFEAERPDVVVNFAAESHVDRSIDNPEVFLDSNIKGVSVLMDACMRYDVGRFHQISTDEVYGDLPLDRPDLLFTEESPICPSSPYSDSKAASRSFGYGLS